MVAGHIVRLFAGALFRGSPLWTIYLRLDGARVGRRVFVNTLGISDHNLLALGDDVVVGADVHIAGHTVEGGMVRTAAVTIGNRVTIGVGSIVSIDTSIGDRCEIGAMSLVPKHAVLEGPAVYVGVPVRRITPGKDSAAAA
jgi:serine acetyltransferase